MIADRALHPLYLSSSSRRDATAVLLIALDFTPLAEPHIMYCMLGNLGAHFNSFNPTSCASMSVPCMYIIIHTCHPLLFYVQFSKKVAAEADSHPLDGYGKEIAWLTVAARASSAAMETVRRSSNRLSNRIDTSSAQHLSGEVRMASSRGMMVNEV